MNPLKALVHAMGRAYCRRVCRDEYAAQKRPNVNERPIEYGFVLRALLRCHPAKVLDVGTGRTALASLIAHCGYVVAATDNVRDYWPHGMFNRHWHVIDDDITDTALTEQFDLITCVSVLEHIPRPEAAVRSLRKLMSPGGHLVWTFPYNERQYVEDVYRLPGVGYGQDETCICQVFSKEQLTDWTSRFGLLILEQEYWRIFGGELWAFGDRLSLPLQVDRDDPHHLTCVLLEAV